MCLPDENEHETYGYADMIYQASCHCGAVQAQVEAPEIIECDDCNCSICAKSGYLHLIVPKSRFQLSQGAQVLTSYRFNTQVATHYFCKVRGVKVYYIPRSNPDGIDANVRSLSPAPKQLIIRAFDGKNWEANAASLTHLSQE